MLNKEGGTEETTPEHTALATLRAHVRTNKLVEVSKQLTEKDTDKLIDGPGNVGRDQSDVRETSTPLSWDSHGAKSYDSHDNQTVTDTNL